MKRFLISYDFRLPPGEESAWHRDVATFIGELARDPEIGGRIRYRCMKAKNGQSYFHLAEPADDGAVPVLQSRDYFKRYTEATKRAGGGEVHVTELETIGDTASP